MADDKAQKLARMLMGTQPAQAASGPPLQALADQLMPPAHVLPPPVGYSAQPQAAPAVPKVNLDAIRGAWDAAGIDHAIAENKGTITLSKIVVPKDQRSQGIGTNAMNQLMDYADTTGQRIVLSPSADFGGNKSRLVDFYKQLGFGENTGRARDFTTRETMIRDPAIAPE